MTPKAVESYRLRGQRFHETLEAAKLGAGSTRHTHEDHDEHDVAVGMALALAEDGRREDAVSLYNAWAQGAGYVPVSLSEGDLIDVVDAVVRVTPDGVEVVECR